MTRVDGEDKQVTGVRPRLGRLFVSSVFGGMMDLRRRVEDSARLLGFTPVLAEDLIAQSDDVASVLEREIAHCDTYVGLFSTRRGTVPDGEHWAITEQEYLLAGERGLRRLAFIDADLDGQRDRELDRFLKGQVHPYRGGVYPNVYRDEDELELGVTAALAALRPQLVLWVGKDGDGLAGRLFLRGVEPALGDRGEVGPFPFDPDLSPASAQVLELFLRGAQGRARLKEDALRLVGGELMAKLSEEAAGALVESLGLAEEAGLTLLLRIRTREPEVLALPWAFLHHAEHDLPVKHGGLEVVRELPAAGAEPDPGLDSAPAVPRRELSILGFTAEPVEDQAEGFELGAGGGLRGDSRLFWEAEQEKLLLALDPVLRQGGGRLVLPDTGDKAVLIEELGRDTRPAVLHLSCHGGPKEIDGTVRQAVHLEDSAGHRVAATSDDLQGWIRARPDIEPPALVVLSACYTASYETPRGSSAGARQTADAVRPEERVGSLAEDLVRDGLPRVLGMQTSVTDRGATEFAAAFYAHLARGGDLALALTAGRAALRDRGLEHEWAIPVLLHRAPLLPLVAPPDRQIETDTPLEVLRGGFEVGGVTYLERGYVGRRAFERRLHRHWLDGDRLIVLHGLGGIGKSTLAARFCERRANEGVRILILPPGERLAATLLEDVAREVGVERPAGGDPLAAEQAFQERLREVLGAEPTVLLLDNFEDNQDPETGRPVDPKLGDALYGLAHLGGQTLRLLFTTRYALDLPPASSIAPRNLDLGSLSPAESRKLKLLLPGLRELDGAAWDQVMHHLGGHPKALEILAGYLRADPDRLPGLLEQFDEALGYVEAGLASEHQERGRKLLIDAVLAGVPDKRLPALDRLCLLQAPLPDGELVELLAKTGLDDPRGDLAWLRRHGILARTVAPSALEGGDAVHRLIASRRQGALASREGGEVAAEFHRAVADHLVQPGKPLSNFGIAAGHLDASGDRAGALKLFDRWAVTLRDRHAYRACEQVARRGLAEMPPDDSEAVRVAAADLYQSIHDGLQPLGELGPAREALTEARRWLEGLASQEALVAKANVDVREARILADAGQPGPALQMFESARNDFEKAGAERDATIALGEAARLKAQSGDVAGALTLHQEILDVYEQLGDVRSRAVTLGDIARLRAQSGDVAGALTLHQEILDVYEQLGDVRSRAVTLGDIARLRAQSGDVAGALTLHQERLDVYEQLGDVRERAVTLGDIARLRAQSGDVAGALTLHQEELAVYEQLGDVRSRAVTLGDIAQLMAQAGKTVEARKFQEERLATNRELGDVDGIAAALFDLAHIDLREENPSDALARLAESWSLNLQLGRADAIAIVGELYGQLLAAAGRAEAAEVLEQSRQAYERLGWTDQARQVAEILANIQTE